MRKKDLVYVAGGDTLIGSALLRRLDSAGYANLCGATGDDPDLTDPAAVDQFFARRRPVHVYIAAGEAGGISANQHFPATMMHHNLLSAANLIHAAHNHGTAKLLYLASSCSYPRLCPQPMAVEHLMSGPLEPTNEAYATAKIAGIKLTQAYRQQYGDDFITGIPANAFGVGDDFSPDDSHVIGALIHRMHAAKFREEESVTVWGTGNARREFIFADDLADACIFLMENYSGILPVNVGGGNDISIRELAGMIRDVVQYPGHIEFDAARPDGMPVKALDSQPLAEMGWKPRAGLVQALKETYADYLASVALPPLSAERHGSGLSTVLPDSRRPS